MDLLDFSSLIEDLIKTQGSVLDVDLWMELKMTLAVDVFSYEFYDFFHQQISSLKYFYVVMLEP